MREILLSLAVIGFSTTLALAQTPTTFADVDVDGNNELSLSELQVAWPDMTAAEFDAADSDASTGLSVGELNTLQGATAVTPPNEAPPPAPAEVVSPQSLAP